MSPQKSEIIVCVCNWLGELADDVLMASGFKRRERSLIYRRTFEQAIHEIKVAIEHRPHDEPNAAAAIYPQYTISIESVNEKVKEMTGGDPQMGGTLDITMHGPVEWNSPKGIHARWYIYQCDSVPETMAFVRDYILKWTVPFLNKYKDYADLCEVAIEGDNRDVHTQTEILRVVAARVLCGQHAEALDVMDRWFGRPGPRKQYQRVFDYIVAQQSKAHSV